MGLNLPSTAAFAAATAAQALPQTGLRGWLRGLSPRDRLIYGVLLALLVVIVGIYAAVGFQLFTEGAMFDDLPPAGIPAQTTSVTPTDMAVAATTDTAIGTATPSATATRTGTPTRTPSATATAALFIPPQTIPSATVAGPPAASPGVSSSETPGTAPAGTPSVAPAGTPSVAPDGTPAPPLDQSVTPGGSAEETMEPDTDATVTPGNGGDPGDGASPEPVVPTDDIQTLPTVPGVRPTSSTREVTTTGIASARIILYFADAQVDTLLVPVTRIVPVRSRQVATAAVQELIKGPQGNLIPVLRPEVQLLPEGVTLRESTITVNFDRYPAFDWDTEGYGLTALALTLTEFPGVNQVQIQVNGRNIGLGSDQGPIKRPVVNPDNPNSLPESFSSGTRFLPLYFRNDEYYVRITRLVPRTPQVARATVVELLDGPERYSQRLTSPIPPETRLIDISKQDNRAVVNLTLPFINAVDQQAALDVLVLSLTELRDSEGQPVFDLVDVFVEGQKLSYYWGSEYDRSFARPSLNLESLPQP